MTLGQISKTWRCLGVLAALVATGCGSVSVSDKTAGQLAGDATSDAPGLDAPGGSDALGDDAASGTDAASSDDAQDSATGTTDIATTETGADSVGPDSVADAATDDTTTDIAPDAGTDTGPPCKPTEPATEVCDGLDNDCDGTTDQPADGAPGLCDDGDACTLDGCAAGKCAAAKPIACDDGNPCTDDACAKATGCVATAKAGPCDDGNLCTEGEACTGGACTGGAVKACDDGNTCTADSCKDGICAHASIAGCPGPIDPFISALTFKSAVLELPGGLVGTLTIKNMGKQIIMIGTSRLAFDIGFSADATWDAGDTLLSSQDWTGYAVGSAKPEDALTLGYSIEDISKLTPGAQYVCVHLKNGGDTKLTNNDACVKIDLKFPQYKVASYTLPAGDVFAGGDIVHQLKITNMGGQALKPEVRFFLSADGVLDDKDVALATVNGQSTFVLGLLPPGLSVAHTPSLLLPNTAAPGKPWACAVVNQALAAKETDAKDNVLCTQFDNLRNPADFGVSAANIMFRKADGSYMGSPAFGGNYTCHLKQIVNSSYLPAKAPLAVRCWVDVAGKAYPGDSNWALDWKTAADIAAGYWQNNGLVPGKLDNVFSVGASAKLRPAAVGASYVCAHLNHDGALDEIALTTNKVCGKITIFGYDLYVDLAYTKVGGPAGSPQVTTLTRGTPLAMQMRICNKGNQHIINPGNLKTRILLSTDDKLSADDSVVFSESGLFGYSQIDALNAFGGPGCVNMFTTKKLTLPMTLPTGNFFLLYDVNHDQVYLDPDGNNLVVGASVTIK